MLDLTKPMRHKKTKAEARVAFTDTENCRQPHYLVVVRGGQSRTNWLGLRLDGKVDSAPDWIPESYLCEFLENTPAKIAGEVWVNVYEDGKITCWKSRKSADGCPYPNRIARIKLPYTAEEGQFDE